MQHSGTPQTSDTMLVGVRRWWTVRNAVQSSVVLAANLPLLFVHSQWMWVVAVSSGAAAGVAVTALGSYSLRWMGIAAVITASIVGCGWFLTQGVIATAVLWVVLAVLWPIPAFAYLDRRLGNRTRWILFASLIPIWIVSILSLRALAWGWLGGPVFFSLIPFMCAPGSLLLIRAWQPPDVIEKEQLRRLLVALQQRREADTAELAIASHLLSPSGAPDLSRARELLVALNQRGSIERDGDTWRIF